MKTESQLAWVIVRAIGLIALLYSATQFIATASSVYMAFTLRHHTAIVIRSDAPTPEHLKDTPQNRQLVRAHGQARAAAKVNGLLFLASLAGGLYCFKGGKALHKVLMPPNEEEHPTIA